LIASDLGGINSDTYLELMRQLAKAPYMVCDADVSYPAPNANNCPSVTGLVWSYDQFAMQYASYTRVFFRDKYFSSVTVYRKENM
jgi:hypothetical protein